MRRPCSPTRPCRRRRKAISFLLLSTVALLWIYRRLYGTGAVRLEDGLLPQQRVRALDEKSSEFRQAFLNNWVGLDGVKIDCQKAILAQESPIGDYTKGVKRISPAQLAADSTNCEGFRRKYGFERYPAPTDEEINFPLAFSIIFHNDLDQVLLLLRALYRSQNVYCLHVDKGSGPKFVADVRKVAQCLPNVIVPSDLQDVVYEGYSRLAADLSCMKDLLAHRVQWKYLINMAGKVFPLRTNLEMVRILNLFKGRSNIESMGGKHLLPKRFTYKYVQVRDSTTGKLRLERSNTKHLPAPHRLKVFKGSAYGTFSRDFVHFAINNQMAQDLFVWSRHINSPDEYVWATLIRAKSIGVPMAYAPDVVPHLAQQLEINQLTVYSSWHGNKNEPCSSIRVRNICIFSGKDLPNLVRRPQFLANKFYISRDPAAMHCLDQLLYNLTASAFVRDLSFYKSIMADTSGSGKRRRAKTRRGSQTVGGS